MRNNFKTAGLKEIVEKSGYFDKEFYLSLYTDVLDDPLVHYLEFGDSEGRFPSVRFSPRYYSAQYPEVDKSGYGRLEHYILKGRAQGLQALDEKESQLLLYIQLILQSKFWDAAYYLKNYPDVKVSGTHPLVHFVENGGFEKRNPSELFNTRYYITKYPDVAGSGLNPLVHFLIKGLKEGRSGIKIKNEDLLQRIPKTRLGLYRYHLDRVEQFYDKTEGRLTVYIEGWLFSEQPGRVPELVVTSDVGEPVSIELNRHRDDIEALFGKLEFSPGFSKMIRFPANASNIRIIESGFGDVLFEGAIPKLPLLNFSSHDYDKWLELNSITDETKQTLRFISLNFEYRPLISVIMPVYNISASWLKQAVDSVSDQVYDNWELCITNDASTSEDTLGILASLAGRKGIKIHSRSVNGHICHATNDAVEQSEGEFLVFLDHDDILHPHALFEIVKVLQSKPETDLIYSDEDKLSYTGQRYLPFFKPAFSYFLLLSSNYFNHLTCIRKSLFIEIGKLRPGFEGAQDYDMVLRAIEKTQKICHIPQVLYSWRMFPESVGANLQNTRSILANAKRAIAEHLQRTGYKRTIYQPEFIMKHGAPLFQIDYPLHDIFVELIIPVRNNFKLTSACINSILDKTEYQNFKILIADNNSDESELIDYYKSLPTGKVHVIRVKNRNNVFSHSYIMNKTVKKSKAGYLLFMNNDMEVIEPKWLSRMIAYAHFENVGAVGAKLLFTDHSIQHAGILLSTGENDSPGHAFYKQTSRPVSYYNLAETAAEKIAVTAACMLTKKTLFRKVGGFDEKNFPNAYNDVDYCLRLGRKGFKTVYCPDAVLYHYESSTRENTDDVKALERFKEMYKGTVDPFYNPNLHPRQQYQINIRQSVNGGESLAQAKSN